MLSKEPKKKSFLSIFEETNSDKNGHPYPSLNDFEEEEFALTDEMDHAILMHREAHFGGDFNVMIDYYRNEGVGVQPEIDLDRIYYLAEVEAEMGCDLAAIVLTGAETEKVAKSRRAYEQLKEIYSTENEKSPLPRLLADLILSEEEEPEEEIRAVVSQGTRIATELLTMLHAEDAYDPLFPGYGYAPYFAIIALGRIKDERAIVPLFETLDKETVFDETVILEALQEIGDKARDFLLSILKGRPLTTDNENAAFALSIFARDPKVAIAAFEELQKKDVLHHSVLSHYLLFCCEGLKGTAYQDSFTKMLSDPNVPQDLQEEIAQIVRDW